MTASEKSGQKPFRRPGPYAVPGRAVADRAVADRAVADRAGAPRGAEGVLRAGEGSGDTTGTRGPVTMGDVLFLPTPSARATVPATGGADVALRTAVRSFTGMAGGAAMGATAAVTAAYLLGRRAGRRSRGPVARLFERRF
ncbi:hypothetical protein [Streptomyces sp. NPDC051921]|uniref:hypothetical protein n=1 Tax=Streptomyces sp. NPDC051921 TaxID=3155806 RepID=UPI00342BF5C6